MEEGGREEKEDEEPVLHVKEKKEGREQEGAY